MENRSVFSPPAPLFRPSRLLCSGARRSRDSQVSLSPAEQSEIHNSGGDPEAAAPSVLTENDGKFIFRGVEPGSYRLTAGRSGYARQSYGQKVVDNCGDVAPARFC